MDRRELLAKATITRADAGSAGALIPPAVSRRFLQKIKDADPFGQLIRQEVVEEESGNINSITVGKRIIRKAEENADDGYRAGVTFGAVPYTTVDQRLPYEYTLPFLKDNLEGPSVEAKIVSEMSDQFGVDISDLDMWGDTAAGAGPDQAFLQIRDGLFKKAAALTGYRRIDGSTINGGAISAAHFFAAEYAMPNRFKNTGRIVALMSPSRHTSWVEHLAGRATGAGDAVLLGNEKADKPLGFTVKKIPQFPDDRIIFTDPANLVRVVSWQIQKFKVTPQTDWELATRRKIGQIYFMRTGFLIADTDAIIDLHSLDPVS